MTVSLLATSCDWFTKSKPKDDPEVVTNNDNIVDSLVTTNDTTVAKKDSTVAVVETKTTETKKEVKK